MLKPKKSADGKRFEGLIAGHEYGPSLFPTWTYEVSLGSRQCSLDISAPDAPIQLGWAFDRWMSDADFTAGLSAAVRAYLAELKDEYRWHLEPPEA